MAGRKSDFTLTKLDDLFSTQEQRDEEKLSKIRDIPLTEIDDFPDHPFKVRDDEDRLHQNYLKRKASGAQKRYEDKIKKRKKAEIEAKKAAIRAEDIANGVFVPVSSLPQREPMKGVQTA